MIIIHVDFDLKKRKNRQLNNLNKYFYYKLFFKKLLIIIFIKLKLFNLYKYKN